MDTPQFQHMLSSERLLLRTLDIHQQVHQKPFGDVKLKPLRLFWKKIVPQSLILGVVRLAEAS